MFISLQRCSCPYKNHKIGQICYNWLLVNNWLFGQPFDQSQLIIFDPLILVSMHCIEFHHKIIGSFGFFLVLRLVHDQVQSLVKPTIGPPLGLTWNFLLFSHFPFFKPFIELYNPISKHLQFETFNDLIQFHLIHLKMHIFHSKIPSTYTYKLHTCFICHSIPTPTIQIHCFSPSYKNYNIVQSSNLHFMANPSPRLHCNKALQKIPIAP